LIDAGKIVEVGEYPAAFNQEVLNSGDLEVIDAKNKYILPGLIDAHCHVGMWEDSVGFEGDDGNEATDPVTPHLRAIDAVYYLDRALRRRGKTELPPWLQAGERQCDRWTVVALKTYGRRIEEMVVKDPVAMKVAFGENPKTVYNERKTAPTTRMATAAILRKT